MFLPDINLWLALAFERHVHHPIAKDWFSRAPQSSCTFCRYIQQGFLRLATNPKAFGEDSLSLTEAWKLYDTILSDQRVVFANEPAGMEIAWRAYTTGPNVSRLIWSDAYLAGFAQTASLKIASFDRGFSRYEGLDFELLTES